MTIAFFHTADLHIATFDKLMQERGFDGELIHEVQPELLARARDTGLGSVETETTQRLVELARRTDCVVCTCSTLGPVADAVARLHPHVIRIDRPMMQAALGHGSDILVALCLESTRSATLDLLQGCSEAEGQPYRARLALCSEAWPALERGDMVTFGNIIAETIRAKIATEGRPDCIVLAQASMRVAEPLLRDLDIPVLSSPALAAQKAIEIAQGRSYRTP